MEGRVAPETGTPLGCRVFWRSEYVSCVRRGFFMAVRMSSRRALGTETAASGQGLRNWHLGDGATCLMRTGGEYAEIGPVWNWRHLPGVTCIDTPDVPLPRNVWGRGAEGGSDFAGGVTDGVDAVAAMELARGGARARKAWFFTGDAVVCLGAGIRADSPGVPLVTGVEQCWARSPVQTSAGDSTTLSGGAASLQGENWVHHDGVTYLFGEDSEIRIRRERREAKWPVVNTFIHAPEPVSGDVFELWIEHGSSPDDAHYHYLVAPGLRPEGIATFQRDTQPRVLSNTVEVQAVAAHNLWQVVFWRPGAVDLSATWRLTADAPCLLQLRQESPGWAVAAGNPTHAVRMLRVRLEDRSTSRVAEASFVFPSDGFAGQPQVRTLRAA
jgi:chondroitin AC lyase